VSTDSGAALATGPFLAACVLLGGAGVAKLVRPGSTSLAARALRLPASTRAVRALGVGELVVATAGAIFGGAAAIVVAAAYAALAGTALVLWRRAPDTPCGCLGASNEPATGAHVALNACAAIAAVVAAFAARPGAVIADQPLAGVPFVALVLLAAALAPVVAQGRPARRLAAESRVPTLSERMP
jgi:hypothetical protein